MGYNWERSLTDNLGKVEWEDIEEVRDVMDTIRNESPASRIAYESSWYGSRFDALKGTVYDNHRSSNRVDVLNNGIHRSSRNGRDNQCSRNSRRTKTKGCRFVFVVFHPDVDYY